MRLISLMQGRAGMNDCDDGGCDSNFDVIF